VTFLALPLRNLGRRRLRSALTAGGIGIAVAGMLALLGLSRGLERNWLLSLQGKGTHVLAYKKGAIELLSASLDQGLAIPMRQAPGLTAVTPNLVDLVELETGQMVVLSGWPAAPGADQIEVGESLAAALGKKAGGTLQLGGREFRIAAVTRQASVFDDRSVKMPLEAMQRLLGREGKVSAFHIRVRDPGNAEQLAGLTSKLAAAFPELSFAETGELVEKNQVMRLLRAIAWSSSTVALAMAFFAVLNTLLMSVSESRQELGLYCAVGWHPARVLGVVVLEGVLLAAAGALLGTALGVACLRFIVRHPQMGTLLQPDVAPALVVQAAAMAMLLGVLGGLYPAWRATRMNPLTLLRAE
jgi:putative ABC transport system permease protein